MGATGVRQLIINADDLGLSPGVNQGIIAAHAAGLVTSASLLMNLPATADALARSRDTDLDVGVHLNLTVGSPLASHVPSLVDASGQFRRPGGLLRRLMAGRLRFPEVEREWSAQIEAFLATGQQPAHLDSHIHLHALPGLSQIAHRLAGRYGIPALRLRGHGLVVRQAAPLLPHWLARRWRLACSGAGAVMASDHLLVLTAFGPRYPARMVERLLRTLPPGLTEFVTHPGYVDAELCRLDPLCWPREHELRLLHAPWWRALLTELGIQTTTYRAELAAVRA